MEDNSENEPLEIFPLEIWEIIFLYSGDVLEVWNNRIVCRLWRIIIKNSSFLQKLVHNEWHKKNIEEEKEEDSKYNPTKWSFISNDIMGACGRYLLWNSLVRTRLVSFGGFEVGNISDMENTILFGLTLKEVGDEDEMSNSDLKISYPSSSSRCATTDETNMMVVAAASVWTMRMSFAFCIATNIQRTHGDLSNTPIAFSVRSHLGYVKPYIPHISVFFSNPGEHRKAFNVNIDYIKKQLCVLCDSSLYDYIGIVRHRSNGWKTWNLEDFKMKSMTDHGFKLMNCVWYIFITDLKSIREVEIPKNSSVFLLHSEDEDDDDIIDVDMSDVNTLNM